MLEETVLKQQRISERANLKKRYLPILEIAKERFNNTAVVKEKEWGQSDVDAARQFLLEAAPFAHHKVYPDLWDHLLINSLYARFLAQDLNDQQINPFEAEVMGLMHDDGRLAIPNHYLRNDIALGLAKNYIGARKDFLDKFFPMEKILGRHGSVEKVEDLTLPQIVCDVTDNIGKRKPNGEFFTPDDVVENGKRQLEKNKTKYNKSGEALWPSESFGWRALSSGKQELANKIFSDEVASLTKRLNRGDDYFKKLRQRVEAEFQKPENQEWLLAVKDAQETLDLAIDEKLGRPKITTVVFDAGGVLFKTPDGFSDIDEALFAAMQKYFEKQGITVSAEQVKNAVLNEKLTESTGGKISESEYLKAFYQALGREMPESLDEARKPFIQPEIYQPDPEMQEIVRKLKEKGIEIKVLSDCVQPLAQFAKERLLALYPEFAEGNVFISSLIGQSKKEDGGPTFQWLLEKLDNPDPQTVLFIDDNLRYPVVARAGHNMRAFTFRGNSYKNLSATQRLKQELEKAKLI